MPSIKFSDKFHIKRLTYSDICDSYLETLNDRNYMRYSNNVNKNFSVESQREYIDTFDFESDFLFAIVQDSSLVATVTLRLDRTTHLINIGFLILREFSGKGLGNEIFAAISEFTFGIFPQFDQEVGTNVEHDAMSKIALNAGFELDSEKSNMEYDYYLRKSFFPSRLLKIELGNSLIVANDAGGAFQIASLILELELKITALLSGPALEIFNEMKVNCEVFQNSDDFSKFQRIICGSGIYGGPESLILEEEDARDLEKICILDNWVNYAERFHPSGEIIPEIFFVSNNLSREYAINAFPNSEILQIPDFYLARQVRDYLKLDTDKYSLLMLLEPESKTDLAKIFVIRSIEKYMASLENIAEKCGATQIVLRLHPSQDLDPEELLTAVKSDKVDIRVSSLPLIEEIARARVVCGFNSYALYLSMKLGVESLGYFAHRSNHWSSHFKEIKIINEKESLRQKRLRKLFSDKEK